MTSLEQLEDSLKAIYGTIPGDMWALVWCLNPLLVRELKEIKQRQTRIERAAAEYAVNDLKFHKQILGILEGKR